MKEWRVWSRKYVLPGKNAIMASPNMPCGDRFFVSSSEKSASSDWKQIGVFLPLCYDWTHGESELT